MPAQPPVANFADNTDGCIVYLSFKANRYFVLFFMQIVISLRYKVVFFTVHCLSYMLLVELGIYLGILAALSHKLCHFPSTDLLPAF